MSSLTTTVVLVVLVTRSPKKQKQIKADLVFKELAVQQERLSCKNKITIKQAMNAFMLIGTMSHLGARGWWWWRISLCLRVRGSGQGWGI